ncbi:hypothetical protein QQS21_009245 [Conoideocrella luteorostrata]|uniref:Nucleoside phosphorylase domain-containing protein n=1 Tax=Conoideocrella luteorostrata TaxID=1105319 RepID=A0AAJ0FQK4_9HYPO|nr:hypothetical protein QQS21_009245 [Conoideocrella luteorostrata]
MATATLTRHPQEYTVAWICALPVEMAAAKAMLDERHGDFPTMPSDSNTYILGSVCGHNIVIACLPSGVYGTTSATTLATEMRSTFKCIRFGLMVGIGGGAPMKNVDIRLGDIVVSKPTGRSGGVIQHDYGKTMSGEFKRTGILNKPPRILLTAVSALEAEHMSGPSKIPAVLLDMVAKYPEMRESFTYRGEEQDLLFDSEYDHCDSKPSCSACDTRKLIVRPNRRTHDPVIHYGLIGSGNQVVKDGRSREKLARELDVLCFEMEAAGLMDILPCLVIRGICDYSDSHKNKQWQGYAAATAAAYAKELLSIVPKHRVINEDAIIERNWAPSESRTSNMALRQNGNQDTENLLERISTYDHERIHQRLSQKRLAGTTRWFLNDPTFREWLATKSLSSLWCSGKIGSGKTMIATAAVDATKSYAAERHSVAVFFYCGNNEYQGALDMFHILSSFIKQICGFLQQAGRPCPGDVTRGIQKFFGRDRTQPDVHDLKPIFTGLFYDVPDTIYIIDGIDALDQEQIKQLLPFFKKLFSDPRAPSGSKILLLSRDQLPGYINIATLIRGIREISTSKNVMRDIETYIETSFIDKTMYRNLSDDPLLIKEIKQVLLAKSNGMFLWVYLQLEILWDTCYTDAEIRSALATLPETLEETYGRCVDRINFSDGRALKVLKWVSFATRPLHVDELREAVAFDLGDTEWKAEKIPQKNVVIGCCANLIVLDLADNCVRFAHSSVKQYLEKVRERTVQEKCIPSYPRTKQGDQECGEFCIAYLSFLDFNLQLSKLPTESTVVQVPSSILFASRAVNNGLAKRLLSWGSNATRSSSVRVPETRKVSAPDRTKYKFLNYAVANWAMHTKHISGTSPSWQKFKQLATCFSETWNFHPWIPSGRSPRSQLHSLFGWAVKEQHIPLLSIAQAAQSDLQHVCNLPLVGEKLPALHVASKLGYKPIVEILLGFCILNQADYEVYTALHHAVSRGHIEVCRLLLNTHGIKVDGLPKSLCTPLSMAASHGHEKIALLLIEKQANVKAKNMNRQTPLSQAAQNGHYAVVKLLLKNKIDNAAHFKSVDNYGSTPLTAAAIKGHEAVVKLLIDNGADVNLRDAFGYLPLTIATKHGHEAIAKLLIKNGADVSRRDIHRH